MKSMTSTRRVHSSSTRAGKTTSASPEKFCRKRRLLRASMPKSSCMRMPRPNSSTLSTGANSAIEGDTQSRRAKPRMKRRSKSTSFSISGRRTLTATTRPSGRRALCTCATDADAIGVRANSENTWSGGRPSSSTSVWCTCW
jgi:hypothetical protein